MDLPPLEDHRGHRRHRFMESADINTAFRELFEPLRLNVRRGNSNHGQVYAIEMDACLPGELLGTAWIPPASRGIASARELADPARRRGLAAWLRSEPRPEQLFAYVGEVRGRDGSARLLLEIESEDAVYVARYPITRGSGWHRRELLPARHARSDALPTA